MAWEAYFYHDASDSFFLAPFNQEFDDEVTKIGLVSRKRRGMNDLMCKILRHIGIDTYIFKQAMKLHTFNDEDKSFDY